VWDNPIVVREMRARMRNNKALGLQFLVLAVLAFTVFSALLMATHEDRSLTTGWLGQVLFRSLGVVQGLLLALLAPAFAAGAFTLEREQQTIESLLLSPLQAGPLVRGKLVAATLFPALLTTLSLPMLSLTLLYGGVGPQDLVGTYAIQLLNGLFLGALAVGWSMVCRSTSTAVVATYLTVGVFLFSTMLLGGLALEEPFALGALCPVMAPFLASETIPLWGRPVPIWLPSAALLLFCTAWCLDVCLVRAKELRLERGSGRPRIWALAFCFLSGLAVGQMYRAVLGGRSGDFMAAFGALLLSILGAGALGALVFGTADSLPSWPWQGWWRALSPRPGSAPLFTALLPWAAVLGFWLIRPATPAGVLGPGEPWHQALALTMSISSTLYCAAWLLVWLQQHLGSRWPAMSVGLVLLALFHACFAEACVILMAEHPHLWETVPAISPVPIIAMVFDYDDGSAGDWLWGSVGLGAWGQFVILLLLWLARATPHAMRTSPAVPGSREGKTPV